jgi:putative ABC transport system ATP-binding protein/lipoprotein-releasing system ATP-binding protein
MAKMAISVRQVEKSFGLPPTYALRSISFEIPEGDFVSISGRSGSGKTTLLYIISTLDHPSAGEVLIDGKNPFQMNEDEIHHFRNTEVGFIFQFHYLLPELTSIENVLLPAKKANLDIELTSRGLELLKRFGLEGKEARLPSQLSGGEQQRVAIARSLIMKPKYIFADEPTGNLDTANAAIVMQQLKEVNRELGTTIVLVTHEPEFAAMAKREIHLVDGRLKQE